MNPVWKLIKNNHKNKGGDIMVWGMILLSGYLHIQPVKVRLNFSVYQVFIDKDKYLNKYLINDLVAKSIYFNTIIARVTSQNWRYNFFRDIQLNTFDWLQQIPDLNIIENVKKIKSDIL